MFNYLMKFHTNSKHGEIFEKTNLGRLPPEILLHILGYVVPSNKLWFQQQHKNRDQKQRERAQKLAFLAQLNNSLFPEEDPLVPGTVLNTFKNCLERHESLSQYLISYSEERKLEGGLKREADITWRRSSELPQPNPDEAFKTFLKGLLDL